MLNSWKSSESSQVQTATEPESVQRMSVRNKKLQVKEKIRNLKRDTQNEKIDKFYKEKAQNRGHIILKKGVTLKEEEENGTGNCIALMLF